MKIQKFLTGYIGTNCYLLIADSGDAAVIDPGGESGELLKALEGLTLRMILLTHAHYDHMGGADALRSRFPGVPVYVHEQDKEMLETARYNFSEAICGEGCATHADRLLQDGDTRPLGELEIRVLHTPGHTMGGVCYLTEDAIFCGDTVFMGSVGRTDLYGGSYSTLSRSVKALAALEGDYTLYPGHGPETTLAAERRQNPYMRADYDDLF